MIGVPRRRFGVALLIPDQVGREIDGLRRACEDGSLGRIPPHVTLVPPVNVRDDALDDALAVLRSAAASVGGPLELTLGPAATFHPATPVLYLEVGGETDRLQQLRDAVFVAPLARRLTWPFVPHVTLAEDQSPARLDAGVAALAGYLAAVRIERVHLLEEHKDPERGRVWEPVADAPFAPPVVVGRGGLPLDLVSSTTADPATNPVFVTARRDGAVVGTVHAAIDGGTARLVGLHVAAEEEGTGVATQLLAVLEAELAGRGVTRLECAAGPRLEAFLAGRGWESSQVTGFFRNLG
jgi:2'-5' RNA ligase